MTVAKKICSSAEPSSWAKICERHPREWVCLLDVENEPDGSIRSARVVGHDRSIERALDQAEPLDSDTTVMHTSGYPLWSRRLEEIVVEKFAR